MRSALGLMRYGLALNGLMHEMASETYLQSLRMDDVHVARFSALPSSIPYVENLFRDSL